MRLKPILPKGAGLVVALIGVSGGLSAALKAGEGSLMLPATLPVVLTLIVLPTGVVAAILGIRQLKPLPDQNLASPSQAPAENKAAIE